MSYYTKATELEKKLKEMKAVKAKIEKMHGYMVTKSNEYLFDNDNELNRTLADVRSMLSQMTCDCNVLVNKFTKLTDGAWFDFYAQEYEEEGEEND